MHKQTQGPAVSAPAGCRGNPLAQIIDSVRPAALFKEPELDDGNAGICQLGPARA
jgi:hypothetical protein